jgi:hypothetical protein
MYFFWKRIFVGKLVQADERFWWLIQLFDPVDILQALLWVGVARFFLDTMNQNGEKI